MSPQRQVNAQLVNTKGNIAMGNTTEVSYHDDGASWEATMETPFDNPHIRALFTTLYGAMFAATVLGNLLVIFVILRHRRMRTVINCFLANLALSDLLVGVFCVLPNLYSYLSPYWHLGRVMCKMYYFVQNVCRTASTIVMMVIALERYIAIVHPMINKRLAHVWIRHVTSAVIWFVAVVYGAPLLAVYDVIEAESVGRSYHDDTILKPYCVRVAGVNMAAHVTVNFVLCYCAPLVLLALVYCRISCVLARTAKLDNSKVQVSLLVAHNIGGSSGSSKRHDLMSSCPNIAHAKSPSFTPAADPSPVSPVMATAFSERSALTASILTARGLRRLSLMDRDRQAFPCHHHHHYHYHHYHHQLGADNQWQQRQQGVTTSCCQHAARDRIRQSGRQNSAECSSSPDVAFPTYDDDIGSLENILDNNVAEDTTLAPGGLPSPKPDTHCSPTHKFFTSTSPIQPGNFHPLGPRFCQQQYTTSQYQSTGATVASAHCHLQRESSNNDDELSVDNVLASRHHHLQFQPQTGLHVHHHHHQQQQMQLHDPLIRRQIPILQQRRRPRSSNINVIQTRRKVVRLLVVVVTSFALCSLPYQTFAMWQAWSQPEREVKGWDGEESDNYGISFNDMLLPPLIYLVLYFNSCLNPLLYALLSENFRKCLCDFCRGHFLIRLRALRRFSN